MLARNVLHNLQKAPKHCELAIPVIIVPEPQDTLSHKDEFLKSLGKILDAIMPAKVTLNLFPEYVMSDKAVNDLFEFLVNHVKCPIILDFTGHSENWINAFYKSTKLFTDKRVNKPMLSCMGADNNREWNNKFIELEMTTKPIPRRASTVGEYTKMFMSATSASAPRKLHALVTVSENDGEMQGSVTVVAGSRPRAQSIQLFPPKQIDAPVAGKTFLSRTTSYTQNLSSLGSLEDADERPSLK